MARIGEFRRVIARARDIAATTAEALMLPEHILVAWGDESCPDPALARQLRALARPAGKQARSRVRVESTLQDRIEAQLIAPDFGIRALVRELLISGALDGFIRTHGLDPVAARDAVAAHG